MVFRWLGVLVAAASLSWFAVLLVTGNYYNEGPVVLTLSLSRGIGVHRGDIGVVAFWAAGMIGLLASAAVPRRQPSGSRDPRPRLTARDEHALAGRPPVPVPVPQRRTPERQR